MKCGAAATQTFPEIREKRFLVSILSLLERRGVLGPVTWGIFRFAYSTVLDSSNHILVNFLIIGKGLQSYRHLVEEGSRAYLLRFGQAEIE